MFLTHGITKYVRCNKNGIKYEQTTSSTYSEYNASKDMNLKLDLQIFLNSISEGHEPQNLQIKTATFADVATEDLKNLKIQPR